MKEIQNTHLKSRVGILITAFIMILLPMGEAAADSILFKNGRRIEGRIITQTRTTVLMRTGNRTRNYSKRTIRRIVYGNSNSAAARRQREIEKRRRGALARKRERERKKQAEEKRIAAKKARKEKERLAREQAERERLKKLERERKEAARKKKAEQEKRVALARSEAARKKKAEQDKRAAMIRAEAARKKRAAAEKARVAARKKRAEEKRKQDLERAREIKRRKAASENPPMSALWRSAVLPGWGRLYFGNSMEGRLSAGLFAVSLGQVGIARNAFGTARADYADKTFANLFIAQALAVANSSDSVGLLEKGLIYSFNLNRNARNRYRLRINEYRASLSLAALVYLAQLGHAWWFAPRANSVKGLSSRVDADSAPEFLLSVQAPDGNKQTKSVKLGIRYRF